jgi:hypothetical protein
MRLLVGLAVGWLVAVASPAAAEAEEDEICEPACGAGATCVNGLCMVPAQAAPPAVTPAPAPPPAPAAGYPPPAYSYPPPAYRYPPPPYGYPPAATAAAARPERSGFLALPYIGINSFSGTGTAGLDPGLRLGALLGGSVSGIFSANGEITVDIMNPNAPGVDVSEAMVHLTFSPLFHARTPSAEFVIGPKLGIWGLSGHGTDGVITEDITESGWTFGANVGAFFPVGGGSISLGMLLSYANLQVSEVCRTVNGYPEMCFSNVTGDGNVLGLTFALLL